MVAAGSASSARERYSKPVSSGQSVSFISWAELSKRRLLN